MHSSSSEIPGDEGHYISSLDVFHQLHCLNGLRKLLYPEYYSKLPMHSHDSGSHHLGMMPIIKKTSLANASILTGTDHCVDSIRQSLMCNADITPIVWEWDSVKKAALPNARTTHVCRDYQMISSWASERQLRSSFNNSVYMPGSPIYVNQRANLI